MKKREIANVLDEMKKLNRGNDHTYKVLNHIYKYGKITSWDAFEEYRDTRLSSTIDNIRKHYNVPIKTKMIKTDTGSRYGEYYIEIEK